MACCESEPIVEHGKEQKESGVPVALPCAPPFVVSLSSVRADLSKHILKILIAMNRQ